MLGPLYSILKKSNIKRPCDQFILLHLQVGQCPLELFPVVQFVSMPVCMHACVWVWKVRLGSRVCVCE